MRVFAKVIEPMLIVVTVLGVLVGAIAWARGGIIARIAITAPVDSRRIVNAQPLVLQPGEWFIQPILLPESPHSVQFVIKQDRLQPKTYVKVVLVRDSDLSAVVARVKELNHIAAGEDVTISLPLDSTLAKGAYHLCITVGGDKNGRMTLLVTDPAHKWLSFPNGLKLDNGNAVTLQQFHAWKLKIFARISVSHFLERLSQYNELKGIYSGILIIVVALGYLLMIWCLGKQARMGFAFVGLALFFSILFSGYILGNHEINDGVVLTDDSRQKDFGELKAAVAEALKNSNAGLTY